MNKMDRLPAGEGDTESLKRRLTSAGDHPTARAVAISAATGLGVNRLLASIDEALPLDPIVRTTLRLEAGDGATLALLHEFGRVLSTRYHGEECEVEAEIPESLKRRLDRRK